MEENNSQITPEQPVVTQPMQTATMQPEQPVYAQPVYAQPVQLAEQPVYAQPAQPVYAQPVQSAEQPVYAQPAQQTATMQPEQSAYAQPQQPVYAQPAQQPAATPVQQPAATQPEQPVYAQPVVTQPMQPAAQPVYTQPIPPMYNPVPPAVEKPKKKGKGGLIAIIIVIVLLLLAAVAVLAWKLLGSDPKDKVAKGFMNLQTEINSYVGVANEVLGSEELNARMQENPYTMDASLNISAPNTDSQVDTLGVDYSLNYDLNNKLLEAKIALSAMNIDLASMDLSASGDTVYVGLPGLVSGTYFLNLDTLGEDFNASAWAEEGTLDEKLSYHLFEQVEEEEAFFAEELAEIWETATAEDSGTAVQIERDGKTVTCNGIKLTLDADACNAFLEAVEKELEEELGTNFLSYYIYQSEELNLTDEEPGTARLKDDLVLYVYLDGKNRITNVATASKIKLEDSMISGISFSLVFSGAEKVLDEVSGTVKLETEDTDVKIAVKRSAEQSEDATKGKLTLTMTTDTSDSDLVLTASDKWDAEEQEFEVEISLEGGGDAMSFVYKGSYQDVKKGEAFTLKIGEMSVAYNGEKLLNITGSISEEPFEGSITMPEGAKDLFSLDEEELSSLAGELIMSLYSKFGMQ